MAGLSLLEYSMITQQVSLDGSTTGGAALLVINTHFTNTCVNCVVLASMLRSDICSRVHQCSLAWPSNDN